MSTESKATDRTNATEDQNGKSPEQSKEAATELKPRGRRSKSDLTRSGSWIISDDTRGALERCELFQDITRQQLMEVAALVEECVLEADEVLLSEGEPANHLFVVINGHGVAQLNLGYGWLSLGLVGPGDAAGWSALMEGQTYQASIRALTQMRVARIEGAGLSLLMSIEPSIGHPVQKRLSTIFFRQYQEALKTIKTA